MPVSVLGIDLASRSWGDNGSCLLTFESTTKRWTEMQSRCVDKWPTEELNGPQMASFLADYAKTHDIAGISLDGPQGWREPQAALRDGVGRLCEYEARCQGKTGEIGKTYPSTQRGWIEFCIDVFSCLQEAGGVIPSTDECHAVLTERREDSFWLIECFPTSIWRTSGLPVLPGKSRCLRNGIKLEPFREALAGAFGLPPDRCLNASHDDLQALVAALPMAGLLGGPAKPIPRGKDSYACENGHWVEGIIWDCEPLAMKGNPVPQLANISQATFDDVDVLDPKNPLLIDDRDDVGSATLSRGVKLFDCLCGLQAAGNSVGVGYAQFVERIFSVSKYSDIVGRNYATSDTRYVLQLAHQITNEAGGRRRISRGSTEIAAGMDTFIWPSRAAHMRSEAAFAATPYTLQEWLTVFPDGERRLLLPGECGD